MPNPAPNGKTAHPAGSCLVFDLDNTVMPGMQTAFEVMAELIKPLQIEFDRAIFARFAPAHPNQRAMIKMLTELNVEKGKIESLAEKIGEKIGEK